MYIIQTEYSAAIIILYLLGQLKFASHSNSIIYFQFLSFPLNNLPYQRQNQQNQAIPQDLTQMSPNNLPSSNHPRFIIILTALMTVLIHQSISGWITPTTVIQDLPYFGSHYIKLKSVDLDGTAQFSPGIRIYQRPLNKIYYKIKSSTILLSSYKCLTNGLFALRISVSVSTDPTTAVNVSIQQKLNSKFSILGISVVLVTSPFDTVMKFYEFDMNIENNVYSQPYTKPALFSTYTYVRSMSQQTNDYYFEVFFTLSTASSTDLRLSFITYQTFDSTSVNDVYNVQAVVILIDRTTLYVTPQLNFFSSDHIHISLDVFSYTMFGINIAKYGKDINKKCILGFPNFDNIYFYQPYFLFDLDPLIGLLNTSQNTYYGYGDYQSFCMQDLSCPPDFPFKKLNDRVKCWDCNGGVVLKQNFVPNCITHDNVFASIKYDVITAQILDFCLKCINCEDHFYADNGDCKLCNLFFPNCVTCQEKIACLTCAIGYTIDSLSNCQPCNSFLPNCQECSGQTMCTKCQFGYFLDANKCIRCHDKMTYCKSCQSATYCLECSYPFILNSDQSGCICQKGRVLTGTCSELSGCISSHEFNSVTMCYACDTQNNWQFLPSFSCSCQKGYSKINETYCENSCGDGLWTEEQCDDGNNLNGDGCSVNCMEEEFFKCQNTQLQKSLCRYIPQITLSVFSLSRQFGTSKLTLKLLFYPFHPIIMSNNWPSHIFINSSQITFDFHEFQDNHLLVLHYNIDESIQTQSLKWEFTYDCEKFLSKSTSLTIPMKGMNAPLTYEAYYKHQRVIEIISYAVGGLAFLIALISMVKADSNIAFETVTTVLFVFYARILLTDNNPAMLYTLSGMRIAEGFNEFFPDQHRDYQEYIIKNRFYIKSQIGLMGMFTLALFSLILLLKVAFQIKSFFNLITSKKPSLKKTMDTETKEWKSFKFFNKAYNAYLSLDKNCFTPITIILLYKLLCMFNAFEDANHRYPSHFSPLVTNIITLIFFVVIIYYMAVGASIVSTLLNKLNVYSSSSDPLKQKVNLTNHQQNNLYADLYVVYLFVVSVFVFFMVDFRIETQNIVGGIEGCMGVVVGYFIVLFVYRPYEKTFNMMAIIMNQIVKLGFLGFLLVIKKKLVSQLLIMIGCYLTLSMLIIIQTLSIIRIKISWTSSKPIQDQNQELKQAFKLNSKDIELKQQRLHNNRKQSKRKKKKLWINYEENMYLYENIVKKQQEQLMKKQQAQADLYEALQKVNRGRRGTKFGRQEIQAQYSHLQAPKDKWGQYGNMKEASLIDREKKDVRSQLEKIKQRIRMSGYINRPKEQLYRLK